jgi:arabinose-5-phosphate isomerase
MKSTKKSILDSARETLLIESEALLQLSKIIDKRFEEAVKLLLKSKGRLVVTGIGKSANIAQKIVATLNSTGQPALFLHAADAIHGDLGNLQKHDVLLCISKSGDSPEIKVLIPLVRSMGNVVIGMTANEKSFLASKSDIVLHTPIDKEACPNNLAPTTSTTVQLAVGDALAVALMDQRGFTSADFAKYHPGGALGKKLYTRMGDLLGENSKPAVSPETPVQKVILEISSKRLGATAVLSGKTLKGVITDGDIRRMLERGADIQKTKAKDIMNPTPKTLDATELAVNGFHMMESKQITQIVVIKNGEYAGIVHLHDILKEGIF